MSSKATSPVVKMLRREEREVEVQEGKETPDIKDMGISYIQSKRIDPPKYQYWTCKRLNRIQVFLSCLPVQKGFYNLQKPEEENVGAVRQRAAKDGEKSARRR